MSDPIHHAIRILVAEIAREVVPAVLAEIAPQLAVRDDEVIPVERAAEVGLTPRSLADAIRRGDLPGIRLGRKLGAKRSEIVRWRDSRAFRPRRPRENAANDTTPTTPADLYDSIARRAAGK